VRAMIVDDNAEFLWAACSLLEREGITVVGVASTGADALRYAEVHDPDVVLVDIGLGEESGFDVAERLSPAAGRRRRVVLISARAGQELEDLIDASPAIGFVPKSRLSANAIIELLVRSDRTGQNPVGLAGFEELEDRQHSPVIGIARRQVELGQDAADVLLDRALGDEDPAGDAHIGRALGHQGEHLSLTRRQDVERITPPASPDELLHQ
jgi:DNA-binding NarL/FixJ family response regulator